MLGEFGRWRGGRGNDWWQYRSNQHFYWCVVLFDALQLSSSLVLCQSVIFSKWFTMIFHVWKSIITASLVPDTFLRICSFFWDLGQKGSDSCTGSDSHKEWDGKKSSFLKFSFFSWKNQYFFYVLMRVSLFLRMWSFWLLYLKKIRILKRIQGTKLTRYHNWQKCTTPSTNCSQSKMPQTRKHLKCGKADDAKLLELSKSDSNTNNTSGSKTNMFTGPFMSGSNFWL